MARQNYAAIIYILSFKLCDWLVLFYCMRTNRQTETTCMSIMNECNYERTLR